MKSILKTVLSIAVVFAAFLGALTYDDVYALAGIFCMAAFWAALIWEL